MVEKLNRINLNNRLHIPAWVVVVVVSITMSAVAWAVNSSIISVKLETEMNTVKQLAKDNSEGIKLNTVGVAAATTSVAVINTKLDNITQRIEELKQLVKAGNK